MLVWDAHLLLEGVLRGGTGVLGGGQAQAADGDVWGRAWLAPLGDAEGKHLQQLPHPAPTCNLITSQHHTLV